jgi:predicted HTH transcriptional regulator
MEIIVPKSEEKPHFAPDKDDKWKAFVRVGDQNLLANRILRQVWKHQKNKTAVKVRYQQEEELLFKYLQDHQDITLGRFCKIAKIPSFIAEKILVNFILLDIIEMQIAEKSTRYRLKEEVE